MVAANTLGIILKKGKDAKGEIGGGICQALKGYQPPNQAINKKQTRKLGVPLEKFGERIKVS